MQDIINATYDLVDEIIDNEIFKELLALKKRIDIECISQINKFNDLKAKYVEISKYGEYHPDIKIVRKELSEAKVALYSNPLVIAYKDKENAVQKFLDSIKNEIVSEVCKKQV